MEERQTRCKCGAILFFHQQKQMSPAHYPQPVNEYAGKADSQQAQHGDEQIRHAAEIVIQAPEPFHFDFPESPWTSVGGYAVAAVTAIDRVRNDRHHWYDVAAGAGIGILSTELTYFVAGKIFPRRNVSVYPSAATLSM